MVRMGKTLSQFVHDSRPRDYGAWSWHELWPMIEPIMGKSLVKVERQVELDSGPEAGQTITMIEIKRSEIAWSYDFYEPPHDSRSELVIRNNRPLGNSPFIKFYYFDIIDEKSSQVTYRLYCSAISGWTTDQNKLCEDLVDAICQATGMTKPPMEVVIQLPKPVAWLTAPTWVTEDNGDGSKSNGPVALCFTDELEGITQSFVKQMSNLTGYTLGVDLKAKLY